MAGVGLTGAGNAGADESFELVPSTALRAASAFSRSYQKVVVAAASSTLDCTAALPPTPECTDPPQSVRILRHKPVFARGASVSCHDASLVLEDEQDSLGDASKPGNRSLSGTPVLSSPPVTVVLLTAGAPPPPQPAALVAAPNERAMLTPEPRQLSRALEVPESAFDPKYQQVFAEDILGYGRASTDASAPRASINDEDGRDGHGSAMEEDGVDDELYFSEQHSEQESWLVGDDVANTADMQLSPHTPGDGAHDSIMTPMAVRPAPVVPAPSLPTAPVAETPRAPVLLNTRCTIDTECTSVMRTRCSMVVESVRVMHVKRFKTVESIMVAYARKAPVVKPAAPVQQAPVKTVADVVDVKIGKAPELVKAPEVVKSAEPAKPAWVPLAQKSALTATVVERTFSKDDAPLVKPVERRVSNVRAFERKPDVVPAEPISAVVECAVPVAPAIVAPVVAAPVVAVVETPAVIVAAPAAAPAVVESVAVAAPVAAPPVSRGGAGGKAKLKLIYGVFVNKDAGSALNAAEVLRELGDSAEWTAPEVHRTLNQLVTLKLLQRDGDKWCVKTTTKAE